MALACLGWRQGWHVCVRRCLCAPNEGAALLSLLLKAKADAKSFYRALLGVLTVCWLVSDGWLYIESATIWHK